MEFKVAYRESERMSLQRKKERKKQEETKDKTNTSLKAILYTVSFFLVCLIHSIGKN